LKNKNKNKRGTYSKHSKRTLRHHKQFRTKLASKGFLPVDEYIRLKAKQGNQNKLTSELGNIIDIVTDELEGGSDTNTPARDTCSVDGTSEVDSEGTLPVTGSWNGLAVRPMDRGKFCNRTSVV
jgi:hypothetical protein